MDFPTLAVLFYKILLHQALCTFLVIYPLNHPQRLTSHSIFHEASFVSRAELSGRRNQMKIHSHFCTVPPEGSTGLTRWELGLGFRSGAGGA